MKGGMMPEYKVLKDRKEFKAPNIEVLKRWVSEGRIKPNDKVYHPTSKKWVYVKDMEELEGVTVKKIILSTGDIKKDYEVVEIIHVAQVIRSWWITTGGREILGFYPEIDKKLRDTARTKGCDAVIWIDYDVTREQMKGMAGTRTTAIITAYGTGVKFK